MERLTFDRKFCDIAQCRETPGGSFCENGTCSQKEVWLRLKAYEDTGLTPGEIKSTQEEHFSGLEMAKLHSALMELKKYQEADKDGRSGQDYEQLTLYPEDSPKTFLFEDNAEYDAFVEKFKPKKTTDDCYTPPLVYDAIRGWACNEYGIDPDSIVRPFYPGGDYERYEYSDGCVVLDNPPFSILSKIISFYNSRDIKFFLFAPALTLLSPVCDGYCGIAVGVSITYENGAKVSTSFATNLESNAARSSPELYKIITEENKRNERKLHRELPKYDYPDNVITATFLQKLSKYGISFSVPKNESVRISALDMQKREQKTIFGKGLLCSDRVAAEKAAAEKAAAEKAAAEKAAAEKENKVVWSISERERKIIEDFVNADKQYGRTSR